jgi:hypothetical protein
MAQTPHGFAKGIGPVVKIEKPDLSSGVTFQIPKGESGPSGKVLLPKGSKHGMAPRLFTGPSGGFISVHIESGSDTAKNLLSERSNHPAEAGEHLVSAGAWLGDYEEHMLRDNIRMGRLYTMVSTAGSYTMMISWPAKDPVARKDAEKLARFVIWSMKFDSGKR